MKSKWERGLPVKDRRQRVAQLHAKGLTNIVIARRLGIADTTVSHDLLALGLRKPAAPKASLAEVFARQHGIEVDELLTPHALAKLRKVDLQALFLDTLTSGERASMSAKTLGFTLAELSDDALIAAVLGHHEAHQATAPEYPRAPAAVSAPARPPAGAPAGAGGVVEGPARPAPDLGPGGDTGDVARPEPMRAAS